jgi:hypothetical protein
MSARAFPILALLVLFVTAPVLACVTMGRDEGPSAAPMDMGRGCTDDVGSDGLPVLCPESTMIAAGGNIELPRDLITNAPSTFPSEVFHGGVSHPPSSPCSTRLQGAVPLHKLHAVYLI